MIDGKSSNSVVTTSLVKEIDWAVKIAFFAGPFFEFRLARLLDPELIAAVPRVGMCSKHFLFERFDYNFTGPGLERNAS